jgi:thiol-disulfide isomerase/thioredoxin
MSDDVLVFSIYSRPECHLCEEMLSALKLWQERYDFKIEVIDIDKSEDLTARYAARIPLLAVNNNEICQYHFDDEAFIKLMEKHH